MGVVRARPSWGSALPAVSGRGMLAIAGRCATPAPEMKAIFLCTAGLFLAMVSCERHEWEDTKALHEPHGDHGSHGGDHHGEKEGEEAH